MEPVLVLSNGRLLAHISLDQDAEKVVVFQLSFPSLLSSLSLVCPEAQWDCTTHIHGDSSPLGQTLLEKKKQT